MDARVLYLTPDAPIDSGTGIYDGVDSDMNIAVGNKYNGRLHIAAECCIIGVFFLVLEIL